MSTWRVTAATGSIAITCCGIAALAESMVAFVQRHIVGSDAVRRLDVANVPATRRLQPAIRELRQQLQQATL